MIFFGKTTTSSPKVLAYIQTFSVFLALFSLGLVSAVFGPSLIDLSEIYQKSTQDTSLILTIRGFGVFLGSLLGSSVLYKFFNGKLVLVFAMIIGGISHAILPSLPFSMAQFSILAGGMCVGVLETGGTVWLVQLWKERVAPAFQMYHLSFGIGALLCPVITEPFLSYTHPSNNTNDTSVMERSESHIETPFRIFGSSYSLVGFMMLALYFMDSTNIKSEESSNSSNDVEKQEKVEEQSSDDNPWFEWRIVSHLLMFIVLLVSIETTIFQFLGVYSVKNAELNFDSHKASYLLADYWATFTVGRIVACFLSFKVSPYRIMINMVLLCLSGSGILVFLGSQYGWSVWLAVGILGFGLAPCYGAVMSWAVQYVKLRYHHMTLVLIASCTGQMLPSLTVARLMDANPQMFVYVIAIWVTIHAMNVILMYFSTKGRSNTTEITKK